MGGDGIILSAPAVWGGDQLNGFYRATLWVMVRVVPGLELTGRGLKVMASDNIEMLRALGADPLFIKATRVDAIAGLVELMDIAAASVDSLDGPLLVLGGARDEIVPPGAHLAHARAPEGAAVHRDHLPRRLAHAAARPAARGGLERHPGLDRSARRALGRRQGLRRRRSPRSLQRCRDLQRGIERAAGRPRRTPRPAARRGSPRRTPRSRASARSLAPSGAARARCPGRPRRSPDPCARSWRSPAEKSIET